MHKRNLILLPFLSGMALRVIYVTFFQHPDVLFDAAHYDRLGWSLAQGSGYITDGVPDIYWAPGYPFLLSALYYLFGHNYFIVKLFQAILSSLLIVLVFKISARCFDEKIAFIASFLTAFYPAFVGYTALLLTETIFIFLLALIIYRVICFFIDGRRLKNFITGLLVGFSALCRAEMLVFPLFVFILAGMPFIKKRKESLKNLMIIYAGALLVVSPWTIRNYNVSGEFIPVTVHDADSIWISSHEEEWMEFYPEREPYKSLVEGKSQLERAKALRGAGIGNIAHKPLVYLKLCFKRLPRFWIGSHSNIFTNMSESFSQCVSRKKYFIFALKAALLFINTLFILLGAGGLAHSFMRRKDILAVSLIIASPIIFRTLIHFFIFSTPRYQVSIMPFMLIFSAVYIQHILRRRKS